jgi:hypothetical protein
MTSRPCQAPHFVLECHFPPPGAVPCLTESKRDQIGKDYEPRPGSFTDQEHISNAADRLDT